MAAVGLAAACSLNTVSIGHVTIDIPDGWRLADREGSTVKFTNGSIAADTETQAGSATAVFDLYTQSRLTVEGYLEHLTEQNTGASREELMVDGETVVILSYDSPAFAGKQEAAFVPSQGVHLIYRAAFPNDTPAFNAGRSAFREAVASMRFDRA